MVRDKKLGKGRPRETFRMEVTGLTDAYNFIHDLREEIDDITEVILEKTARKMMGTAADDYSIKAKALKPIPIETGRLRAVFGAVDGAPNTGYIIKWKEALRKSDRPLAADVIWEKVGKFQWNMGTDLHYAHITQQRDDWMGTFLRGNIDRIHKYVQGRYDHYLKELGKNYGFK